MRECVQRSRRVGSLCPGVRDLLQWLMGFLCEAPRGSVHNHWARPQPRKACPSHEKGGKEAGCGGWGEISIAVLYSLSFPLPIHASFIFFPPKTIQSYLYSHLFFTPGFFWPLSSAQNTLLPSHVVHPDTMSKACFYEDTEETQREKKREKKKSTGENEGVDDEEPQSPTLPASSSLRFGYVAPSSRC